MGTQGRIGEEVRKAMVASHLGPQAPEDGDCD